MKTYKEVAKEIVLSYFQTLSYKDKLNVNELSEILYIQNDDKVLLQHIKAMKNIFENAIKEMEDSD